MALHKQLATGKNLSEDGCKQDLHNRSADSQNRLPFSPVQRQNREQCLQEWNIQNGEMEGH